MVEGIKPDRKAGHQAGFGTGSQSGFQLGFQPGFQPGPRGGEQFGQGSGQPPGPPGQPGPPGPARQPGWTPPSLSLPKGGGAIRGIGEKFATNPVTGTASMTVPLAVSPGRSGFTPQLSLSYDSGAGNSPFGFGWSLSLPAITRKTEKGLPRYDDAGEESDTCLLSGAEDLVPLLRADGTRFEDTESVPGFTVHRYRPRIEGLMARIERWADQATGEIHWRSITRENITTLYGKSAESRIADPTDPRRVFSWLISESYDDRGNAILYEYVGEDRANLDQGLAYERNRLATAGRYLKRVRYGNRVSRLLQPDLSQMEYLFEVVFDYDEDHCEALTPDPTQPVAEQHRFVQASASPGRPWSVRPDPFSAYRAGFEVRTYRRCSRVLMFHRFAELGSEPTLVRSTEFSYADIDLAKPPTPSEELSHQGSTRFASFIQAVTQSGYVREKDRPVLERDGLRYVTYLKKSLPPLEFTYSKAAIRGELRDLDTASLENLPTGLDGAYLWTDLDGEGLSGILTEQGGGWFYKPNLGEGRFGPQQLVAAKPAPTGLGSGELHLMDLAGDGQLDLVALDGPTPGFYERTRGQGWEPFRPFSQLPQIPWDDPALRFIDLDGDGHADLLITEGDLFTWYPSLAEDGFGPARQLHQPWDEERGPRLVLDDGTQSIYLADMCGDGLTDLVRIRNGEVCYWPNLGHGRFGARVTMENGPWFDHPDQFSQKRIRLADTDGSGTTDIIYLGGSGLRLYFNQSGNRWSDPLPLEHSPPLDDHTAVTVVDLLGNGTACLVWSSSLPGDAGRPLRYIDLMSGVKPHLLTGTVNNLGAESRLRYAPSTRFYLADRLAGREWATRLPFPVHVVERVETYDHISGNRFVTRYAYHDGHFDGTEREFRGFGMVEHWDTEEYATLSPDQQLPAGTNLEQSSHLPPVLTRTWFHTGGDSGAGHGKDATHLLRDDDPLAPAWTAAEEREAWRALKGSLLRQEVYGLDGSADAVHPYLITEQRFTVLRLQPKGPNQHAVFLTHGRDSVSYQLERDPGDPRITQTLTLQTDRYGNTLKAATVAYGRQQPDPDLEPRDRATQNLPLITYTESRLTDEIDRPDSLEGYHLPVVCEVRTYQLTGYTPSGPGGRFQDSDFIAMTPEGLRHRYDGDCDYQEEPGEGRQRRLIEQSRTYYRRSDMSGPLPLGELALPALTFEGQTLALTPGMLAKAYAARVTDTMLANEGGYRHSEGDGNWWIPSGQVRYSPGGSDTPAQELAWGRAHFYLPCRYRDPFYSAANNAEMAVSYDGYDLLLQESCDALGNRVTAGERGIDPTQPLLRQGQDYRLLQPWLIMDPNRNCSAVAFDALGLVVQTAMMGKPEESPRSGDRLDDPWVEPTDSAIAAHMQDPLSAAHGLLGTGSVRLLYDLDAYQRSKEEATPQPAVVCTLTRERHESDLAAGEQSVIQHSFTYTDGFGRVIQKKSQAEPGPGDAARWVGSGWTIFNNKGNPVRQYEPFFTSTHRYECDVRNGVSPVLCYDPLGRLVVTLHPDHTWERVRFGPWRQESWDQSDTVLITDPRLDPQVGGLFRRLPEAEYLPTWYDQRIGGALGAQEQAAAEATRLHGGTPAVAWFDPMGRPFLTVTHNRIRYSTDPPEQVPAEEFQPTRLTLDIESNQRAVTDALERTVLLAEYDMVGNRLCESSVDAGQRLMLCDLTGQPLYGWDSRGHQLRFRYDLLRRPTDTWLRQGTGAEALVERILYGESLPDPEGANLRGRVAERFDQAGKATCGGYDFKGNLLVSHRRLARGYKERLDWSQPVALEDQIYTKTTRYDGLDRPTELTAPDGSGIRPAYNEASLVNRVEARLQGDESPAWTPFIINIDYDAKGQRSRIDYGNGVSTTYQYDPLTLRLIRLITRRDSAAFPGDNPEPPDAGWPGSEVQNLAYSYDPVGNVTAIRDGAQQAVYFRNRRVEPSASYGYDALYRLIEATGREHLGQSGSLPNPPTMPDGLNRFHTRLDHPGDGLAMGRYRERYRYDAVGNILAMQHRGSDPAHPGWSRCYQYAADSNRLLATGSAPGPSDPDWGCPGAGSPPLPERYEYDAHGNITRMAHLPVLRWDHRNQLQATSHQAVNDGGTPETTWYVYDAGGQRVRKVTERQATAGESGTRMKERIYLDGFEIYREYGSDGQSVTLERQSLQIPDAGQRVALAERRTQGADPAPQRLIRYQLSNHLGSVGLELDELGRIITYEEYTPYGSTAYQAVRSQSETPSRYRFTGKERDEESGLYYHGARYYAPWLGRWLSPDPAGLVDGTNLYRYVRNSPVVLTDPGGTQPKGPQQGGAAEPLLTEQEVSGVMDNFEARLGVVGQGLRETILRLDIDEPTPVSRGGAWDDAANKQFLERLTNQQTKNAGIGASTAPPRPQISLAEAAAKGPEAFREAAFDMLTRRFSEVRELAQITREARGAMRSLKRPNRQLANAINRSIRHRIARGVTAEEQLVQRALREVGIDPTTLEAMPAPKPGGPGGAAPVQAAPPRPSRPSPERPVERPAARSTAPARSRGSVHQTPVRRMAPARGTGTSRGPTANGLTGLGVDLLFYDLMLPKLAEVLMISGYWLGEKTGANKAVDDAVLRNLDPKADLPRSDMEVMERVTGVPFFSWGFGF